MNPVGKEIYIRKDEGIVALFMTVYRICSLVGKIDVRKEVLFS